MELALVAWSPDNRRLFFCTSAGECHIIDAGGNPISQVPLQCKVTTQQSCMCHAFAWSIPKDICLTNASTGVTPYMSALAVCSSWRDLAEHVLTICLVPAIRSTHYKQFACILYAFASAVKGSARTVMCAYHSCISTLGIDIVCRTLIVEIQK